MVKETLFQKLGKDLSEAKTTIGSEAENVALERGIFLFLSFDLVDSTIFKTEHPALWSCVFTSFYNQILEDMGVEEYKTPNSEPDDEDCVRRLWKLIGDEVLIYVQINQANQLYRQISSVSKTLDGIMNKIANRVESEFNHTQRQCFAHCRDIKNVILSMLGIKTTVWIAKCEESNNQNASNIIYCPITTSVSEKRIDFLGREIDEGFRIAKYAAKNKIIVSPLLAWLIWKYAQRDHDQEKIIDSNFRIISFISMKGVWSGRKVPILMYHQEFEKFIDILEYDELDSDTYANVKEVGYKEFNKEERFQIKQVDSILKNVHRWEEAEEIYEELCNDADIQISSNSIRVKQEFHIACMVFGNEDKILIHVDPVRGYEFGCIKKIYKIGKRTWKEICEDGYKEKYDLEIKVSESPVPVATYYYEKSNAIGIIIVADFTGEEAAIQQREDWKFMKYEEIEDMDVTCVEGFKQNVQRALELKHMESDNGEE